MRGLDLLGLRGRDRVTGFVGVVTSVSYDLYGCVMVVLSPPVDDKGEVHDGKWFDSHRIEVIDGKPVMAAPDFGDVKGPAEKPRMPSGPR